MSETPSVFTGKITHAERNLTKMDGNRAKELEQTKKSLAEASEEVAALKSKLQGVTARRDVVENQLKDIKFTFQSKLAILVQKAENDDKLIAMLKEEIKRLENVKNVKSTLQTGAKLKPLDRNDEIVQLRGENAMLKNSVKCQQIELEKKAEQVSNLMNGCLGVPDERLEEKDLRIAELEDRLEELEHENFRLTQEGSKAFRQTAGNQDQDSMVKDITKQNALLRRKLDDALQKIAVLEKK